MKIQDIKVKTVDTKKLIEFLGIQLPENQQLFIFQFAVFEDKFEISPDCVFCKMENHFINKKNQKAIQVECFIERLNEKGQKTMNMSNPVIQIVALEDYLQLATEVNLVDFIRFNYNPRISNNQNLLMKYIQKSYQN